MCTGWWWGGVSGMRAGCGWDEWHGTVMGTVLGWGWASGSDRCSHWGWVDSKCQVSGTGIAVVGHGFNNITPQRGSVFSASGVDALQPKSGPKTHAGDIFSISRCTGHIYLGIKFLALRVRCCTTTLHRGNQYYGPHCRPNIPRG